MSASLPLWALDMGLVGRQGADKLQDGKIDFEIRNTNTGVVTKARMTRTADGSYALAQIPGVDGAFPGVDLFLRNPVGAKTGALLQTGAPIDLIEGHWVSQVAQGIDRPAPGFSDIGVDIENPAGILQTIVVARTREAAASPPMPAVRRTAYAYLCHRSRPECRLDGDNRCTADVRKRLPSDGVGPEAVRPARILG